MPERTPFGKIAVFEHSTGRRLERWPVDARELVERGDHSYEPPSDEPKKNAPEKKAPEGQVSPEAQSLLDTSTRDLRGVVEEVTDRTILEEAERADSRTTAVGLYRQRIDQLTGTSPLGEGVPVKATSTAGPGKPPEIPGA